MLLIAMDRAPYPSVRSYDADGRLHVASSNISKANVCPYLGREIPNWQELGLDADRVYHLFRDPAELAKAVQTFNNLPVLSEHVPVTSFGEDSHQETLVVGSTGTDAAINGPYLTNSLVVWARKSIDGIETNEKRELSSAYRYRADMTPGNFGGVDYDGVMRDIIGNHVALVFEGRAGSDVIIGDEKPMAINSRRALVVAGSLGGLIRPMLAQDAKFDLSAALSSVSHATLAKDGAPAALAAKVFGLAQPHLATDSGLTVEDVTKVIVAAAGMALDGADDLAEDEEPDVAEDGDEPEVAEDEDDKPAMDSATVQKMVAKARREAVAEGQAIRTAEREVAPIVGELVGMDSAADIYKAGLDAMKVDLTGVPASAYGAVFRSTAAARAEAVPILASDSRRGPTAGATADFHKRFPNRTKLIRG